MSNKSEATWYPNGGPEVPHADLIARLRGMARNEVARDPMGALTEAAAALDSLSESEFWARHYSTVAHQQRDEARAERDALAAAREQADHSENCMLGRWCTCFKSTAPAVSLAQHDAEVKAQAIDEALEILEDVDPDDIRFWLRDRAATIRKEAK